MSVKANERIYIRKEVSKLITPELFSVVMLVFMILRSIVFPTLPAEYLIVLFIVYEVCRAMHKNKKKIKHNETG